MGSARVLFGLFCFAGICSGGMSRSGDVSIGQQHPPLLIRIAQKEIGVRESSPNAGPRVDMYNAYVGMNATAWCASFVSWCHGRAGYAAPSTAWSPALFPPSKIIKDAVPGTVFGIYFPELKRIAHCGMVERMQGDVVQTIEGNTNIDGGREGIGVFRRLRHRRSIASYADWTRPVPP